MHTAHWLPDSGTVLKARPPICTMATCTHSMGAGKEQQELGHMQEHA
jgi:hypothetical protein